MIPIAGVSIPTFRITLRRLGGSLFIRGATDQLGYPLRIKLICERHSVQSYRLPTSNTAWRQLVPPSVLTTTVAILLPPDQAKPQISIVPRCNTAPSDGTVITDLTCNRGSGR